jgi:hypothetical protein
MGTDMVIASQRTDFSAMKSEGFSAGEERWIPYDEFDIDIDQILGFQVEDRTCTIDFMDKGKTTGRLIFADIVDFRYAFEDAFLDRVLRARCACEIAIIETPVYPFPWEARIAGYDSVGVSPLETPSDYVVSDAVDTGIEILTATEPTLIWPTGRWQGQLHR